MSPVALDGNSLRNAQSRAAARYALQPKPAPKDEWFRFSNLSAIVFPEHLSAESPAAEKIAISLQHGSEKTVQTLALADYHEPLPEIVADHPKLHNLVDKILLWTAAEATQGSVIRVARGARPIQPIQIHENLPKSGGKLRNFIEVAAGANVTIVEEFSGGSEGALFSAFGQIVLGEGAELKMILLQDLDEGCDYQPRYQFHLEKNAKVSFYYLATGGRRGQFRALVQLAGEGADFSTVNCVYGDGMQQMDAVVAVHHQAPHTRSGADHWAVMADEGRGVFNGLIQVDQAAHHTDAFQKSRSLLLSAKANVHSMPKLIIATDEVACQHGASVSRVDPEQRFYLESRGLSPAEATRAIVVGFTAPVLDTLPTPELRERFLQRVESKGIGEHGV